MIDPNVQFGRPCIASTGVPTAIVCERYKAGDAIEALAHDFGCKRSNIEAAIRYEFPAVA